MMNLGIPPLPLNVFYRRPFNYPKYVKDFDLNIHVRQPLKQMVKQNMQRLLICLV